MITDRDELSRVMLAAQVAYEIMHGAEYALMEEGNASWVGDYQETRDRWVLGVMTAAQPSGPQPPRSRRLSPSPPPEVEVVEIRNASGEVIGVVTESIGGSSSLLTPGERPLILVPVEIRGTVKG